jgi:hypothetical protein
MNKFRPQDISKRYTISLRLKGYDRTFTSHNWQSRTEWYPVGYKLNKRTISKQFGRLHYLACHAPTPIQRKWRVTYNNFHTKHFGAVKGASMRYLNTWSAHSWL